MNFFFIFSTILEFGSTFIYRLVHYPKISTAITLTFTYIDFISISFLVYPLALLHLSVGDVVGTDIRFLPTLPRLANKNLIRMEEQNNRLHKKARVDTVSDKGDDLFHFYEWLLKNKCEKVEQLEFKEIMVGQDSLRCTFLRECVDTDGIIARIPAALMMPSCRAKSTTVGRKLEERARELGLEPSNHSYLAAWLMYQRSLHLDNEPPTSSPSDNSTKVYYAEDTDQPIGGWGPYICVLPRVYDDPLWWSAEVCFGVLYGDRLEPRNRKREGGSKMRQKAPLCSGALLAKLKGRSAEQGQLLRRFWAARCSGARPPLGRPW